ncbi:hypothetical protein JVU11DRAFT_7817 [Chiua virens]|nr:hypothetical protein JVU11DRAFT_7817 [Chiua virens]
MVIIGPALRRQLKLANNDLRTNQRSRLGYVPHPPRTTRWLTIMIHPTATLNRCQNPNFFMQATISDHIKVRFDQGFDVRDVMTGFESRWVHLGNVSTTVTSVDMDELLCPYKVDSVNLPESSGRTVTVKVQFASTEDAIKAVMDLNGIEFAKRTITAKLSINNSSRGSTILADTDVQLVWDAPSRAGYAGYETLEDARAALKSLNGALLDYLVMTAQLYEGLPCVHAYNVMLEPIPANVTVPYLRKFTNAKDVMVGPPNYDSLDRAINFNVLPAPYKDGKVKAWARFTSPAEARAAQDDLDQRSPKIIGHTTLSCRHVVSVSHVLSAAMYKKIRGDIGLLRLSWQDRYGSCISIREHTKENDETGPTHIRLSSERPELLSILKYEYEQLLHGETVTLEKKPLWDDFLIAPAGRAYIGQMQAQYPGVHIEVHLHSRTISLWGPMVMRHRARQEIVRKVVELKAQQLWKIPLSGKLFGIFHSTEFSTLRGLLGFDNCILDFGARVLVVRGNDSAFRTACDVIQDLQSRQGDVANPSENVCPVCFGEAVVPMSLACGHRWCRSCLTSYLSSAVENRMFPLKCLGNDATCTQCVPLGISRRLLSAADFNAVIEAAFWSYVHSRPDEFHPLSHAGLPTGVSLRSPERRFAVPFVSHPHLSSVSNRVS